MNDNEFDAFPLPKHNCTCVTMSVKLWILWNYGYLFTLTEMKIDQNGINSSKDE